jgi:predicted HAD superfamily phosphohydrolase
METPTKPLSVVPDPEEKAAPQPAVSTTDIDADQIDAVFKELKTLLSTVEKLQKARQDVGDIKPLLVRLLDGELLAGEQLEEVKSGVGGLSKLMKLYSDYQTALQNAQPARDLLDQVLKS